MIPTQSKLGCSHLVLGSSSRTHENLQFLGPINCFFFNCSLLGARGFSSSVSKRASGRNEKPLPWLAASMERKERGKAGKKEVSKPVRSSWEVSAERFLKSTPSAVEIEETSKFDEGRNEFRSKGGAHIEDEPSKFERRNELRRNDGIHIEDEPSKFVRRNVYMSKGGAHVEDETKFERRNEFRSRDGTYIEDEEEEVVDDPRWYNIRKRYDNFVPERAEVRRWDKQENWGKKTWKEAKESTMPKIVGEGVYGVGPVLAALSAGRREFYALYIQEGLDLSSNNRKKKDKKGFEKILKVAEKIGLCTKEVSKHDLNMVVDNRPHQGLVLDASPLEMVGIKELEPVFIDEGEKGPLWLALDEVTDPQNLGAIIRSACFFGASGVVLCAKNSAPLSGVVSKASAGSLELMELRACKNMMQFLTSSAGNGWRVLGASVSPRSNPLSEIVAGAPTILVLGSEGTGLRPLVERSCSQLVRIPGNTAVDLVVNGDEDFDKVESRGEDFRSFLAVESLNVSVAAGVLLNHLIGGNNADSGRIREGEEA
ncbi:hypothetical protein ACS0TY_000742 [Phlomoides rotata]